MNPLECISWSLHNHQISQLYITFLYWFLSESMMSLSNEREKIKVVPGFVFLASNGVCVCVCATSNEWCLIQWEKRNLQMDGFISVHIKTRSIYGNWFLAHSHQVYSIPFPFHASAYKFSVHTQSVRIIFQQQSKIYQNLSSLTKNNIPFYAVVPGTVLYKPLGFTYIEKQKQVLPSRKSHYNGADTV